MNNLLRLNLEEIHKRYRLITSNEVELVIKYLPTSKSRGPNGFTDEEEGSKKLRKIRR